MVTGRPVASRHVEQAHQESNQSSNHARMRIFSQTNAMLYVFEDNEAVIKMIIKGRSPTMRHVCQEPSELLLIGCLTEINSTLRFKSGTLTPNTRSQTY